MVFSYCFEGMHMLPEAGVTLYAEFCRNYTLKFSFGIAFDGTFFNVVFLIKVSNNKPFNKN